MFFEVYDESLYLIVSFWFSTQKRFPRFVYVPFSHGKGGKAVFETVDVKSAYFKQGPLIFETNKNSFLEAD